MRNESLNHGDRFLIGRVHIKRPVPVIWVAVFLIFHFSFFLFSCSSPDDTFVLKGKFKNFNQGELYIYSLQGKGRIDTVRLADGRFSYDTFLDDTLVLSVVFPNFSEVPVVAIPGSTITMQGDASHLKEVAVEGNSENKALTDFRLKVATQTPPEAQKTAAAFIREHPASPASLYLLNKYFLLTATTPSAEAAKLIAACAKASPHRLRLQRLQRQVEGLRTARVGAPLPRFSAVTTRGARVTQADVKGTVGVVSVWATWSYESQNIQRQLRQLKKKYGSRLQLLSICLDGNPEECKAQMERDSITWYTVCDGQMWSSPVVEKLGICRVPDVIIVDSKGKMTDRGLNADELKKKVEKVLGL